jgi:hypothetical protein
MRLYYDAKNPGLVTVDRAFYRRLGETSRRTLVDTIVVPIRTGRACASARGSSAALWPSRGRRSATSNAWNLHNRASGSGSSDAACFRGPT